MYSYTIMFQCPSSCYSIKLVQPSHTLIRKHNLLSSVRPGSPWLSSENFLSLVLPTVLDDPALFGWLLLVATFLDPYSSMHHSRDSCSSSSVASPSSSWIPMFLFWEILLQDTAKMHNMLMDTAKTRICPKTPQIRGSLPRHTAPIILIISQIRGEWRWVKWLFCPRLPPPAGHWFLL